MANIKFSQFTAEADIANFDDIVGYAGAVNTRITPANLASSLITLSGGPYLPLTAGASEKLTGDLNLAATGAGPSVGSNSYVPLQVIRVFASGTSAADILALR